jgi:hypothetical protein
MKRGFVLLFLFGAIAFFSGCGDSGSGASANVDSPTALCVDGTYSYSQSRSGTCSGHGGVKTWLKDI